MSLSSDLISQFVKATKDEDKTKKETNMYGTVKIHGNKPYVILDGSNLETPIVTTTDVEDGERVTVMIKDHTAIVTGNISSPSARTDTVKAISNQVGEFETVVADTVLANKVVAERLEAETGRIDNLVTDNLLVREELVAVNGTIVNLEADNVKINETLTANSAKIETIETTKIDATVADIKYATITNLEALSGEFHTLESTYGEFEDLSTKKFSAIEGDIENLETNKLSANEADLKYVNIDFANVDKAWFDEFYATSGIIENVTISEGTVVKELVGVTIKGDLIEAGTLTVDRLVVLGSDGNYYALNTDFTAMPGVEPVDKESIHGSILIAESVTAEKISVDDLIAFNATIAGFNIKDFETHKAMYSGVKDSIDNTTEGIYLDSEGQMSIGDGDNFIKFYKDQNGANKLQISLVDNLQEELESITIGGRNLIRNSTTLLFDDYYFELTVNYDDDGNAVLKHPGITLSYDESGEVVMDTTMTATSDGDDNVTLI